MNYCSDVVRVNKGKFLGNFSDVETTEIDNQGTDPWPHLKQTLKLAHMDPP